MSLLVNFHDKCDIKGVTFTFPSEKSHIHLGLGGLGTSWRCMADSQTLGWKVLPSHMDCSWLTTVPVQLKMPEKRRRTFCETAVQFGWGNTPHWTSGRMTKCVFAITFHFCAFLLPLWTSLSSLRQVKPSGRPLAGLPHLALQACTGWALPNPNPISQKRVRKHGPASLPSAVFLLI